jgi:hypothetical protein
LNFGVGIPVRIKHFNRYELKYVLYRDQAEVVSRELLAYLEPDAHGADGGRYEIASLYYDTADYKAYWDKIEGQRYRRKLRVRIYGDGPVRDDSSCFVEIKQRLDKTLQKKRVLLPISVATTLCGSGQVVGDLFDADRSVVDEIRYLSRTLQLQPTCLVSYRRYALDGGDFEPDLRVTFDTNLKSRSHDLTLLSQRYAESHFFLPPQWCIMEIKVNQRVPYWLTEIIGKYRLPLRRISKYCSALEQSEDLALNQRVLC